MAKATEVNQRTVQYIIKKLVTLGVISIFRLPGTKALRIVVLDGKRWMDSMVRVARAIERKARAVRIMSKKRFKRRKKS